MVCNVRFCIKCKYRFIVATHNQARDWADNQSNVLVPGTQAFEDAFDDITSKISYLEVVLVL